MIVIRRKKVGKYSKIVKNWVGEWANVVIVGMCENLSFWGSLGACTPGTIIEESPERVTFRGFQEITEWDILPFVKRNC